MVGRLRENEKVDSFMEKYWPKPFEFDLSHEVGFAVHDAWLRRKWGDELVDRYREIAQEVNESDGAEAFTKGFELYSFLFSSGMCADCSHVPIRSREVLRSLLLYFSQNGGQRGLKLVDFGCGDGKITTGVALHAANTVGKIYAVDYNKKGLERMCENAGKLEETDLRTVAQRVVACNTDFSGDELKKDIDKREPRGVDYVIEAFAYDDLNVVIDSATRLLKQNGKIICFRERDSYGMMKRDVKKELKEVEKTLKKNSSSLGFDSSVFDYREYYPGARIVGAVFERRN